MNPEGRRWISIKETGQLYGLSTKACYALAAAGKIPVVRLGRTIRVDRKGLEAQLENQLVGAAAAGK